MLNEISAVLLDFKTWLLKVVKKVQEKLTWLESSSTFPTHFPQKIAEGLNIELALLDFGNKSSLRLTTAVEKTMERCT